MRAILFVLVLLFAAPVCEAQRPVKTKHNRDLRRTMKAHKRKAHRARESVHHVTAGEKIGFGVLIVTVLLITYPRD